MAPGAEVGKKGGGTMGLLAAHKVAATTAVAFDWTTNVNDRGFGIVSTWRAAAPTFNPAWARGSNVIPKGGLPG
jgi:hypothetical protein